MLFYPHYTIVVTLWLVYQQHAGVINGECHDITICQELNNLIPEPTDVTIQSRSFNQTDSDYNKLLEEFYIRRIHNSSWIANIDCAACYTDRQEFSSDYQIVRTGVDKLVLERHPMRLGNANVLSFFKKPSKQIRNRLKLRKLVKKHHLCSRLPNLRARGRVGARLQCLFKLPIRESLMPLESRQCGEPCLSQPLF